MANDGQSQAPFEPAQWCELHEGRSADVEPLRRVTYSPLGHRVEIVMACPRCLKALQQAALTRWGRYAGETCHEVVAPVLKDAERKAYYIELLPLQVIYLRAQGIKVIRCREESDAES